MLQQSTCYNTVFELSHNRQEDSDAEPRGQKSRSEIDFHLRILSDFATASSYSMPFFCHTTHRCLLTRKTDSMLPFCVSKLFFFQKCFIREVVSVSHTSSRVFHQVYFHYVSYKTTGQILSFKRVIEHQSLLTNPLRHKKQNVT